MKKEKGSITLFSLLALLLVTATIFALLEGTRLQEMRRFAVLQTESALESVFANYNTCLWENYRLLGADSSVMQDILEKSASGRVGGGVNLLRLLPETVQVNAYTCITDGSGSAYMASVASYMRENFIYEAAKEVYSQYQAIKEIFENSSMDTKHITDALEELEKSGEQQIEGKVLRKSQNVTEILKTAKYWMEIGVIDLFVKNIEELSQNKGNFENCLLERKLEQGENSFEYTNTWIERILFQQYLQTYMSSYVDQKENRVLSYELEYLIGKKESDIENLKITITKLLTMREVINYLYLLSDTAKVAQAESMAILLVGATGNGILVKTVELGLLAAWAFGESVLDVRALLAGKKITLLKNDKTWNLELESLGELSNKEWMAKDVELGLGYEEYLGILLLFENDTTITMHSMTIQEMTIRQCEENPVFCMDSLITNAKVQVRYSYKEVFPFLSVIHAERRWKYEILTDAAYGYY